MASGFRLSWSNTSGCDAGAGGLERAIVVGGRIDAEALGQAPAPGPLLAAGTVVGPGHDVVEGPERLEAGRRGEPGAEEDVLVGEGEHGPAELVLHDGPQDGVALGAPLDGGQPDEHARRAADALERGEGEALELPVLPGLGGEHPRFGLLGEEPDLVRDGTLGAEIGQFGQLCVAQRGAVLGLDLDRHSLASPRMTRGCDRSSPVDASGRRNSAAGRPAANALLSAHDRGSSGGSAWPEARSGEDRGGPEQDPELAQQGRSDVDRPCFGEPQHLPIAQVEQHRRVALVLREAAASAPR